MSDFISKVPVSTVNLNKNEITKPRQHVRGLDFLRAVAALSVCLFHFSGVALPKVTNIYMKSTFGYGWLGVEIFFVISGFIIPYSLLDKEYLVKNIFPYLAKRIIRINPPAYIAMFFVLAQWAIIDYFINHNKVYTENISIIQIFYNMIFVIPFTKYQWVVGIFWTLAIEFQFYIFVGLFFGFIYQSKSFWKFIIGFSLISVIQYFPFSDYRTFFHFSSLFAIGGAALMYYRKDFSRNEFIITLVFFIFLSYFQLGVPITLIALITLIFILWIPVEVSVFSFIGKISYSFYLIHVLVGTTAEFVLIRIIRPDSEVKKAVITLFCIMIALVFSYIYYLFIEKPFINLAKKYGR